LESSTGRFLPDLREEISQATELEAQILLARAALAGRRTGAEAGARIATDSIDPFSGQPLRSRVEPDGTLVLWSVGGDRVDDGGVSGDPPKDLVWRIPKR